MTFTPSPPVLLARESLRATVTMRVIMYLLLLGLEEEGARTLTDRDAQLWRGRGAVKGLLPHHHGGGRLPAMWPEGRAVPQH